MDLEGAGELGITTLLENLMFWKARKNGLKTPVFASHHEVIFSSLKFSLPPFLHSFGEGGRGSVNIHDEAVLFSSSYSLPEPVGVSRVLFKKHSEQKKLKTENEAFAVYAAAQD